MAFCTNIQGPHWIYLNDLDDPIFLAPLANEHIDLSTKISQSIDTKFGTKLHFYVLECMTFLNTWLLLRFLTTDTLVLHVIPFTPTPWHCHCEHACTQTQAFLHSPSLRDKTPRLVYRSISFSSCCLFYICFLRMCHVLQLSEMTVTAPTHALQRKWCHLSQNSGRKWWQTEANATAYLTLRGRRVCMCVDVEKCHVVFSHRLNRAI